jgi:uncharacterized delta-60 repeat protein
MICLAASAAFGVATACGDGDDGSSGGGAGKGGSEPSGGSAGASGDAGDGGSPQTGGSSGASGSSGRGGTAGSDTGGAGGAPGGAGGDAGGGSEPGGMGGAGGETIQYWSDGVTANGISSTVDDRFHGVAIDAQNNVYATGYLGNGVVETGTTRQVVVAKFGSNAELVTGFGTEGLALADISQYLGLPDDTATTADDPDASQEMGRDLALQSDGKIVVAGTYERPGGTLDRTTPLDIFVMRFDTMGVRDDTFNANGPTPGLQILNPNGNSTNPLVYGVSIDQANRIYVFAHGTATHLTRTDQDRYVYRLNANGALDMSFGSGGFFTFDTPSTGTNTLALPDNVRRGAVLPDGRIVVAGYTNVADRNQIILARLLEGGTVDMAFSGDGVVRLTPFRQGMAECYGVAVQADGSIVTTGYGNVNVEAGTQNTRLDMVSFRVRPDGNEDPIWAGNGSLALDVGAGEDRGRAILALPDDRILIAGGGTRTASDKDSMLVLLERDGTLAADFDMDGSGIKLYGSFGTPGDEFFSVAQSPGTTNRIVAAAGYAPSGGTNANGNGNLVIIPIPAAP